MWWASGCQSERMAFFTAARVSNVIDRRPQGASPGDETRVDESTARIDEKQHSRVWDGRTKRATCCCCCCWYGAVVNERLRASALGNRKRNRKRTRQIDCTAALQHAQQGG